MITVTTDYVPGREIAEALGIVRGSTVRARNVGRDIMAGLKNIVGGEVSEYTRLMADSREEAIERMVKDAHRLGADAIINVRFMTSNVITGAAEMLAYGTAVKIK
ncbi:MAG: YbjQ family protein [Bacteroidales bacterium]